MNRPSRPRRAGGGPNGDSATAVDLDPFVSALDYSMLVVTLRAGAERAGCLVGFATQVSIDPPRLLVCLSRTNHTTRVAAAATHLGVHQLTREQIDLARRFGEHTGDTEDKFAGCRLADNAADIPDAPGAPEGLDAGYRPPILLDAPAYLIGRILQRLDLGDHIGMLLEPEVVHRDREAATLTFQTLPPLDPGHPA